MRRRIVVAIVSVALVAVVLFAVPLAFTLTHLYREEEIIRLARGAAEAAEKVPESFPTTTDPTELPQGHDGRHLALYDRAASRVAGVGPALGDAVVRRALRGDVHDAEVRDTLVVASPVTRGERVVGALRAAGPLSAITNRTRDAILLMTGTGALVVGISALIATWQARRLARPIDRLARAATRLGDGDFTIRTEASGVPEVDAVSNALDSTAARLDQMLTRERSFSEDASHQLRTPLTGLRVTLEAARLDPSADRDAELDTAIDEVDRLDRTIDDLLALARDHPTERAPLDLASVLRAVDDDWHGRVAAEGRPLRVITDLQIPWVRVSDRALRQILDVLVDNAWHHGAGEILVHTRRAAGGVVIEVTDEGEGIRGDPERIFDRRAAEARHYGIGLALARSLAEADGLRLNLVNSGPRPTFAVFLPTAGNDGPEAGD